MIIPNILIRFTQQVLQFAIILFIAKIAGPEGYGYFSIFIAEVAVISIVLGLCLEGPVLYFVSKNKLGFSVLVNMALSLLVFQFIAFAIIYFTAKYFFLHPLFLTSEKNEGVVWGGIYVFSLLIYNYCNAFLSGKGKFFPQIYLFTILQVVLLIIVAILYKLQLLPALFFRKAENIIPLFCCMFIIQAAIGVFLTVSIANEKLTITNPFKKLPAGFINYAAMVFLGNLIQFFAYRADIWLLDFFKTKAEVGQYALAVKIGQIWWVLPQLLGTMIFPLAALEHTDFSEKKFRKYIKLTLFISIAGALVAALFLPYFIYNTAGSGYKPVYHLLLILLPGLIFFTFTILFTAKLPGEGNIKINVLASTICLVLIIILDVILIPDYGATGAAIASSIAYTGCSIFVMLKYREWNQEKK